MGRADMSRDNESMEEGVAALELEVLIDGPSRFRWLESTLNRLSKWAVVGTLGGVILWRHDAEAMWFVIGSILNSILSFVLKRVSSVLSPSTSFAMNVFSIASIFRIPPSASKTDVLKSIRDQPERFKVKKKMRTSRRSRNRTSRGRTRMNTRK